MSKLLAILNHIEKNKQADIILSDGDKKVYVKHIETHFTSLIFFDYNNRLKYALYEYDIVELEFTDRYIRIDILEV